MFSTCAWCRSRSKSAVASTASLSSSPQSLKYLLLVRITLPGVDIPSTCGPDVPEPAPFSDPQDYSTYNTPPCPLPGPSEQGLLPGASFQHQEAQAESRFRIGMQTQVSPIHPPAAYQYWAGRKNQNPPRFFGEEVRTVSVVSPDFSFDAPAAQR